MGTVIIKPKRDEDVYVLWSTNSDGPWMIGTREETLDELIEYSEMKEHHARPETEDRLDRTDKYGTSERIGVHTWVEDSTWIWHQIGTVKRSNIGTLAELELSGVEWPDPRLQAIIEPFEDED